VAEIEKTGNAEEKLAAKRKMLVSIAQKAERVHTVKQLLKAYTFLKKMWNMW
jgi:hypothetical protein